jgi:hypothetical protein
VTGGIFTTEMQTILRNGTPSMYCGALVQQSVAFITVVTELKGTKVESNFLDSFTMRDIAPSVNALIAVFMAFNY